MAGKCFHRAVAAAAALMLAIPAWAQQGGFGGGFGIGDGFDGDARGRDVIPERGIRRGQQNIANVTSSTRPGALIPSVTETRSLGRTRTSTLGTTTGLGTAGIGSGASFSRGFGSLGAGTTSPGAGASRGTGGPTTAERGPATGLGTSSASGVASTGGAGTGSGASSTGLGTSSFTTTMPAFGTPPATSTGTDLSSFSLGSAGSASRTAAGRGVASASSVGSRATSASGVSSAATLGGGASFSRESAFCLPQDFTCD